MEYQMPPSVSEVQAWLKPLSEKQVATLAKFSGVGFGTLSKIRRGQTANPGLETVRRFVPYIKAALLT
jgi:transcriptional regulator with XRE-family HTH domain